MRRVSICTDTLLLIDPAFQCGERIFESTIPDGNDYIASVEEEPTVANNQVLISFRTDAVHYQSDNTRCADANASN